MKIAQQIIFDDDFILYQSNTYISKINKNKSNKSISFFSNIDPVCYPEFMKSMPIDIEFFIKSLIFSHKFIYFSLSSSLSFLMFF